MKTRLTPRFPVQRPEKAEYVRIFRGFRCFQGRAIVVKFLLQEKKKLPKDGREDYHD